MNAMITKVIIGILVIGFAIGVIDSAEGFIEFKKYKVINSPKVCGDKLCSEVDERIAKKGESSRNIKFAETSYVLIFQRIQNHLTNQAHLDS